MYSEDRENVPARLLVVMLQIWQKSDSHLLLLQLSRCCSVCLHCASSPINFRLFTVTASAYVSHPFHSHNALSCYSDMTLKLHYRAGRVGDLYCSKKSSCSSSSCMPYGKGNKKGRGTPDMDFNTFISLKWHPRYQLMRMLIKLKAGMEIVLHSPHFLNRLNPGSSGLCSKNLLLI